MIESEASVKGRVVAEMLSHFTNDLKIGKKIKSGELRKRMIEPPWIPPAMFNLTGINMDHFTMKLLSLKENPNTDYGDSAVTRRWLYGSCAQCVLCVCRII